MQGWVGCYRLCKYLALFSRALGLSGSIGVSWGSTLASSGGLFLQLWHVQGGNINLIYVT